MTVEDHLKWLSETVAIMTEGYIIKRRDAAAGFKYEEIDGEKLSKKVFNIRFDAEFDLGVDEKGKPKKVTKKITSMYFLQEAAYQSYFQKYDDLELFTDEPNKLSRFIPPAGDVDKDLAKRIIEFFRNKRIKNPRAFDELISSHAYRLRYPNAFIEKIFVYYSKQGNTGKSFLAGLLAMMYPGYANVQIKHNQVIEDKNGFIYDLLMAQVEELQGTEYADKRFATWVKQSTSPDASARKMYKDTYSCKNRCLVGFNTNQTDLYGLAREDDATISRLVILDFEKPLTPDEWSVIKTEWGLDPTNPNYKKNVYKVGASLYHYLLEDYVLVEGFNSCRYYNKEKYDLIDRLRKETANLPEQFVMDLKETTQLQKDEEDDDDEYIDETIYIIERKRDKRSKESKEKVVIKTASLKRAFTRFIRDYKNSTYGLKSVQNALERIGFEMKHTDKGDVYIIDASKFDEWKQRLNPADDSIDLDDYEDV